MKIPIYHSKRFFIIIIEKLIDLKIFLIIILKIYYF